MEKFEDDRSGNIAFEFLAIKDDPAYYEKAITPIGVSPREHAENLVRDFNAGEKMMYGKNAVLRKVISIRPFEIVGAQHKFKLQHRWRKKSAVSVVSRGKMFDRMYCEVCGITGKRKFDRTTSDGRRYCKSK